MRKPATDELFEYLAWLASRAEVIVVDGSDGATFADHARRMPDGVGHCAPDADLRRCANGKVAGVITGIRAAAHSRIVIADDDVRYDAASLDAIAHALDDADVVRPQNYFDPMPWHAYLDTARTLLNRVSGGDWPGTLGVRRDAIGTRGYDGDVLFENLELIRTVVANGGKAACPLGLYVRRQPPSSRHFWSQRVRQAYDEFARPLRLAAWLSMVPLASTLLVTGHARTVAMAIPVSVAIAEVGRRRAGGATIFPAAASLAAPLWIAERAICAWLAVGAFAIWGGIPYRGRIIRRAATPVRLLRARLKGV